MIVFPISQPPKLSEPTRLNNQFSFRVFKLCFSIASPSYSIRPATVLFLDVICASASGSLSMRALLGSSFSVGTWSPSSEYCQHIALAVVVVVVAVELSLQPVIVEVKVSHDAVVVVSPPVVAA